MKLYQAMAMVVATTACFLACADANKMKNVTKTHKGKGKSTKTKSHRKKGHLKKSSNGTSPTPALDNIQTQSGNGSGKPEVGNEFPPIDSSDSIGKSKEKNGKKRKKGKKGKKGKGTKSKTKSTHKKGHRKKSSSSSNGITTTTSNSTEMELMGTETIRKEKPLKPVLFPPTGTFALEFPPGINPQPERWHDPMYFTQISRSCAAAMEDETLTKHSHILACMVWSDPGSSRPTLITGPYNPEIMLVQDLMVNKYKYKTF